MKLLRFAVWNAGIRTCDVVGPVLDAFALWWERATGRESIIYGCRLHPASLLPHDDLIPEAWWEWFGWRKQ